MKGLLREIILNKRNVQDGIENLIDRHRRLIEKTNKMTAYSEKECEEKLCLLKEREIIESVLNYTFDLQTFQYIDSEVIIKIE